MLPSYRLAVVRFGGRCRMREVTMKKNLFQLLSAILIVSLVFAFMPQMASAASARIVRDRVAPTAPRSLKARSVTSATVTLSWSASRDARGVSRYEVYGNGRRVAVTASLSCAISNLQSNRSYKFTVRAFDAAGNRSRASNTVAVKTKRALPAAPTTPPAPPVIAPAVPAVQPPPVVILPADIMLTSSVPAAILPAPTAAPTAAPTTAPTATPTAMPTAAPTAAPTTAPAASEPVATIPITSTGFAGHDYGSFSRDDYGASVRIVPSADGLSQIDVGSIAKGVALVRINAPEDGKRWKAIVKGPNGTYALDLTRRLTDLGLPLSFGSGSYTVSIYEQVSGGSYSPHQSYTFSVALESELSPFVAATLMTEFSDSSATTQLAARLVAGKSSQTDRIDAIYQWIVHNIVYDRDLAYGITSGAITSYVLNPDATLASRKGICYDYAALMAAMLRSQGIPTRLVIGQIAVGYHAWNEVYLEGSGWVTIGGANYQPVAGQSWLMFDATLAASSGISLQTILTMTRTRERIY